MIAISYGKLDQILGHLVQHVKPKVMMRLRKKVIKFLKCQVIPQSKYVYENKKGTIDIYMCDNFL